MYTASREGLSNSYARFRFRAMTPSIPPESSRFNTMSNENVHPIYGRFMPQESEHSKLSDHTKGTQTIETVDDKVKQLKAESYQDGEFQGIGDWTKPSTLKGDGAERSAAGDRCYQEEGKADRDNHTAVITLLGSFILMLLMSFVASTLFPTPSRQQPSSSTITEDITPILTPVHMMGFN
jgi:hypothetical protein